MAAVAHLALADPSDETLVHRVLDGDDGAFRLLYNRYHRHVATVAWRMTGTSADVDDLVQETFLIAAKTLDRLRDVARVKRWLTTIVVRRAGRRLDRRRQRRRLAELFRAGMPEQSQPDMLDEASDLYAALGRLSSSLRTPWILARIQGESLADTAAICECSVATVKRRLSAAQKRLEVMCGP